MTGNGEVNAEKIGSFIIPNKPGTSPAFVAHTNGVFWESPHSGKLLCPITVYGAVLGSVHSPYKELIS
jgi:hypothetical protein